MIGLDTNVLVRYIMQDDPVQAQKASTQIESLSRTNPGFVTLVTLVEIVWVVSSSYSQGRENVGRLIDHLLNTEVFVIERADIVWQALRIYQSSNADFSDCLIEKLGMAAGCSHTITFDVRAAKAAGMVLID